MGRERVRLVLLDHPDVVDAAVVAVGEREVDQPVDACEWHRGLGALGRQDVEAPALAAREHEREDGAAIASHPGIIARLRPWPGR
jgi:hypothetical protein